MILNCENALAAYVELFPLLTQSQRLRLANVAGYVMDLNMKNLML